MTRMEQAREAAAAIANKRGLVDWGYAMLSGERDNDPEVQIALRASEMERDRIVAWLREDAVKILKRGGRCADAAHFVLATAADALARDEYHKETNDAEVS